MSTIADHVRAYPASFAAHRASYHKLLMSRLRIRYAAVVVAVAVVVGTHHPRPSPWQPPFVRLSLALRCAYTMLCSRARPAPDPNPWPVSML